MNFEDILRGNPCLTSRGIDDPERVGFKTSRAVLSADGDGFKFACRWLSNHSIRSATSHNVPNEIANSTHRRIHHGTVIAAVKAMGIRFKSVHSGGLRFSY